MGQITGLTRDEIKSKFQEGWHDLIDFYYNCIEYLSPLADINVKSAYHRQGMLFLRSYADHAGPEMENFLNMLTWQTERKSVRQCEVCGERTTYRLNQLRGTGYRRTNLPGKPVRCWEHYVEEANKMADKGWEI